MDPKSRECERGIRLTQRPAELPIDDLEAGRGPPIIRNLEIELIFHVE